MSAPDFAAGVNGMLPAIAQDVSSKLVLMLAWMNKEAYDESVQSGFATYYSRSKKRLWRKGEKSGHRQRIVEIRIDCDADCILLIVEQTGAACHEGYASCFFRKENNGTYAVDKARIVDPEKVYNNPRG